MRHEVLSVVLLLVAAVSALPVAFLWVALWPTRNSGAG